MGQRRYNNAREIGLECEESGEPRLTQRGGRRPHMDPEGLHPTLEPSCALFDPRDGVAARLLVCGRIEGLKPVARSMQAHPKIGILGDVIRVPAAKRAKHADAEVRPYVANAG